GVNLRFLGLKGFFEISAPIYPRRICCCWRSCSTTQTKKDSVVDQMTRTQSNKCWRQGRESVSVSCRTRFARPASARKLGQVARMKYFTREASEQLSNWKGSSHWKGLWARYDQEWARTRNQFTPGWRELAEADFHDAEMLAVGRSSPSEVILRLAVPGEGVFTL